MPKTSWMQNSFNAGELSPKLRGRIDIDKYANGCEVLENFIPQIYGPARKRPGVRFVKETKTSENTSRLIPFQYSTNQSYVLEFGDKYIRFYKDGGVILSGLSPYEIVTPYDHTDVNGLHFVQSADILFLVHPNYPPYKLSRFDHDDWTIDQIVFDSPVFDSENLTETILTASATTGAITLTSSVSLFATTDVGAYYKFTEVIGSKYDNWQPGEDITSGDYRYYSSNLYIATTTGTTGVRAPVHLTGNENDGGVDWDYIHSGFGYAEITAYTSDTLVSATVIKTLPSSTTTGVDTWSESAWSDYKGYPKAVAFYEDRLWFAGTVNSPQTLWASVTGNYEDFSYGTNDDRAMNYTINSQEVNTIQWLSPGKVLAIGTSGSEFTVSASSLNEAVTPTNIKIVPQTTYGGADIQPFKIGSSTLFVQRALRKIREYIYSFDKDSYVAPDMTMLSEHITQAGITNMSYQQSPDQIMWVPDAAGILLGLTYEREEDVVGWHRHDIGGLIESITTIPHWDGDQDSTWLIVNRTINGDTVRYVEYIEKEFNDNYSFYVDSGLTYDGAPATIISGLDHLEGEEIAILADGSVHPNMIVVAGEVTLQKSASIVVLGLPYVSTLKTMPIEAGAADGVAQGKKMRVTNIVMRLFETGPGLWFGPDTTNMNELQFRNSTMAMGEPVPLFTGDTELQSWPGDYQVAPQITIQHRLALPCTVIAVMPQVHTYDR
jgi:hypothetical protein